MGSVTQGTIFRWVAESSWGTPPAAGTWTNARITGETLTPNLTVTESDALREDGQVTNQIETDSSGTGEVNGELMSGEWDGWMRTANLSSGFRGGGGSGVALSATSADFTTVDFVSQATAGAGVPQYIERNDAGDWESDGWKKGMWGKVTSATNSANNVIFKVVGFTDSGTGSSDRMHVQVNDFTDANTDAAPTITELLGATNGVTTATSYAIEVEDVEDSAGTEFRLYKGQQPESVRIDFPQDGKATITFSMTGKKPTQPTSSAVGGGSTSAQGTTEPMIGGDIFLFREGNPELGTVSGSNLEWNFSDFSVLGGSVEYSPSLRPRREWGTKGPARVPGRGTIRASGSFRLYYNTSSTVGYDDQVLANKALNNTTTGFAVGIKDSSGNFYIFEAPRAKISSFTNNSPGKDQDVIADVSFSAYRNPDDNNEQVLADGSTEISGVTWRILRGTLPS